MYMNAKRFSPLHPPENQWKTLFTHEERSSSYIHGITLIHDELAAKTNFLSEIGISDEVREALLIELMQDQHLGKLNDNLRANLQNVHEFVRALTSSRLNDREQRELVVNYLDKLIELQTLIRKERDQAAITKPLNGRHTAEDAALSTEKRHIRLRST
jgi:hypothetical protein